MWRNVARKPERSRRLTLALSLALLALAPLTQAHAAHPAGGGGAAVLLRYHFVPGQTLTYAFDETAGTRIDTTGTRGLPPDTQSAASALCVSGAYQRHRPRTSAAHRRNRRRNGHDPRERPRRDVDGEWAEESPREHDYPDTNDLYQAGWK